MMKNKNPGTALPLQPGPDSHVGSTSARSQTQNNPRAQMVTVSL